MNSELTLIKVHNPFNRRDRSIDAVPYMHGQTLLDLRRLHFPIDIDVTVSVNGAIISKDQLAVAYPCKGDEIIFVPGIHGSGENEKNVYRTVLMIAVTVVAFYTQQYWLVGSVWGIVAAGAIAVAGGMLINALLPPAKPKIPELNGSAFAGSQLYSWSPQTLQQQGIPMPVFYGVNKLYGNIIDAYTSDENDRSRLNLLISLGLGPQKQLSSFKINDQAVEYFGIVPEVRLGHLNQSVTTVGQNTATEFSQSVRVETTSPYLFTTPGSAFGLLEVEVLFPNGLWKMNDTGGMDPYSISIKVFCQKVGLLFGTYLTGSVTTENVIVTPGRWSLGYWLRTDWSSDNRTDTWVQYSAGDYDPNSHVEGDELNVHVTSGGEDTLLWCVWHWFADTFKAISVAHNYEIFSASSSKPIRKTYILKVDSPGDYNISVRNLTETRNDPLYGEAVYVVAVREIKLDGFQYPRQALVGLAAVASDKLSGTFRFSCITSGKYCRIYNGATWSVDASTNPAWVTWDILTQPVFDNNLNVLRYDGIDPSVLDLTRWLEWAVWCDVMVPDGSGGTEKRVTFNGGFDTAGNMWDAAHRVAEIGRASIIPRGTGYTVVVDKPANAVQLFTVGNINQSSFKETWMTSDLANEVQIDYVNAANDYKRDSLLITNPDMDPGASPAQMQFFGVTKASEIWRHGRYRLACNEFIKSTAEWDADIDAITCELGDVANVQHDVPTAGAIGGRIVTATSSTADLDQSVTIEAGKTYTLWVRSGADDIQIRTVTNAAGTYTHLTLATPFTTTPVQYDIFAFGEADKIVKPYRILGIKRARDLQVRLVGVEYNESIYNTDLMLPALPTPDYTSLDPFPPVTNIQLTESLLAAQDGTLLDVVDITFIPPADSQYRSANIWYCIVGDTWKFAGNTESDHMRIPVQAFKTYIVALYTVNLFGNEMPSAKAPTATISTLGKMIPPADVMNFAIVQNSKDLIASWTHVPDVDRWAYEIRQGITWESARLIVSGETSDRRIWPAELNGTYRFLIKAIDSSGNYSVYATSFDITITNIDENLNIILSQDEITKIGGPDGTKTNFVFVDAATPYLTMPHMLTDTDVPNYDDTTADLTDYTGNVTLTAEYVTLSLDTFKIGDTWTRILPVIDAMDPDATDQSYPDRTDQTYPLDTDTHVTMPVIAELYLSYSDDETTWSAFELYTGTVQKKFRYIKVKFSVDISSATGIFKLFNLLLSFDVPDIKYVIENFAVAAGTGTDINYADYGLDFYFAPQVWGQLVGGAGKSVVPDISAKTATGCHADGIDRSDAKVAANFDMHIQGY
jgi:predicted phage tail protein